MDFKNYIQDAIGSSVPFLSKDDSVIARPQIINRGAFPKSATQPETNPKTKQSTLSAPKMQLNVSDLSVYQGNENDKNLLITLTSGKIDYSKFFNDARKFDKAAWSPEKVFSFFVSSELQEKVEVKWDETDIFKIASGIGGSALQTAQEATNAALAAVNDNIVNPFTRMKFGGIKPRDFGLQAFFYPKNQKQNDTIQERLKMLKDEILPKESGVFLEPPSAFTISFGSKNSALQHMIDPGLCIIRDISINYTPLEGKATFYKNWNPKAIKVDISLSEITPLYNSKSTVIPKSLKDAMEKIGTETTKFMTGSGTPQSGTT